jgi:hypothetical protein
MTSISFEEAIELSSKLLAHIERGELETASAPEHIAEIVKEAPGARGFLVAYLTGDSRIAEENPQYILSGLAKSELIVSDLITRNIVMSSAAAVEHRRNANQPLFDGSKKVARRSLCLAKVLASKRLKGCLTQMQEAIRHELSGEQRDKVSDKAEAAQSNADKSSHDYVSFLKRWNYDREQLAAAEEAIVTALELTS